MNGQTIRQSLAILALGFATITTGCKQTPKGAAYFEAMYGSNKRTIEHAARVAYYKTNVVASSTRSYRTGAMVAVYTIDRALTLNEIRSQYNQATADEFVAQGLNR